MLHFASGSSSLFKYLASASHMIHPACTLVPDFLLFVCVFPLRRVNGALKVSDLFEPPFLISIFESFFFWMYVYF